MDVRAVDAYTHALDAGSLVRRLLDKAVCAFMEFQRRVDVLVREDHLRVVRLIHQQRFAQGSRALPEHVIGAIGDDRAKRKDEVVDVLLVQVVRRHRVGDGVRSQLLRPFFGEGRHILGVQLDRVVLQLVPRHGLQASGPARQVGVALHPSEAVQVDDPSAGVKIPALDLLDAGLFDPLHVVHLRALCDERVVKEVAVERNHDMGAGLADECEESADERALVRLIVRLEYALVLGLWRVLQRLDVLGHLCAIDD
mmetsp:Transcript_127844/g.368147  ORF Transcript_127844/g.368147 Transcript_127844/m.368147 type:complete len:254 (-) Transcript_127844:855-1616(-)